jgi:hypothetical protein
MSIVEPIRDASPYSRARRTVVAAGTVVISSTCSGVYRRTWSFSRWNPGFASPPSTVYVPVSA